MQELYIFTPKDIYIIKRKIYIIKRLYIKKMLPLPKQRKHFSFTLYNLERGGKLF